MTRKILALVLAVVMVIGLFAGCNTNNSAGTTNAASTTKAAATTKAASTTKAAATTAATTAAEPESNLNDLGVLPLVKEPVTLTLGVGDTAGVTADCEEWTWLEEQTGVNLDVTLFPAKEFGTKVELMIAAGGDDLPNVLAGLSYAGTGTTAMYNWGSEDFLVDLAPYMYTDTYFSPEGFADPNVGTTWEELIDTTTNMDGTLYYFPSWLESYRSTSLWASYDWVTAAGFTPDKNGEYITTMNDFITYLEWVRDTDPNGNGKKDEIPLIGYNGSDLRKSLYSAFLGSSGGYGSFAYIDGEVVCSAARPEYQELAIFVNKLVKDKLLDPLTFSQDRTSLATLATSDPNVVGAVFELSFVNKTYVNPDDKTAVREDLNTNFKYPGIPIDGLQVEGYDRAVRAFIGWSEANYAVTQTCEDVQLAVRLADFWGSKAGALYNGMGKQGVEWDYVKDVDWAKLGIDKANIKGQSGLYDLEDCYYAYTAADQEKLGTKRPDGTLGGQIKLYYAGVYNLHNAVSMSRAYDFSNLSKLQENVWKMQAYHQDQSVFPTDEVITGVKYTEEEQEVKTEIWSPINTYINECFTRFAMDDLDPVADWDAYIEELYAMGLEDVLAVENAAYNRTLG